MLKYKIPQIVTLTPSNSLLLSSNDALNAIILGFNGLNLIILLRFLRPCALTGIDAKKRKPQKRFFEISSQPPDDSVLLWEKEKKIKHHL